MSKNQGFNLLLPSASICLICIYGYLRIICESVSKVHIRGRYCGNPRNTCKSSDAISYIIDGKKRVQVENYKQAPGPLPWPILGNLVLLRSYDVPFQGLTDLAKQYGDVYTMTLGTTRCLVVNNLNLIREILNQKGKSFGGRPDFMRYHALFGGNRNNSLALCDWSQLQKKRRKFARKYFSPRNGAFFQNMSDIGSFEVQELLHRLSTIETSGGAGICLKPLLQQTCANMFCNYMCSVRFDYDDMDFQNIVRYFDEIFWEINQGYAIDFLPWLSPFYAKHINKICLWSESIRAFIQNRIINKRERIVDEYTINNDFTDTLLKGLAGNEGVTRDNIIYMLEDFIGGHSAIGNLVMLALSYIVKNPETGLKIQAEADRVLTNSSRLIIQRDAERMPYTMSTIYEVLRYCSSPIVPHVATEDTVVAGYSVSKGTIVFINNYELNTSTKYWTYPEKFDPERFLMPLDTSILNPITNFQIKKNIPHFLPFSIGKRTCIGQSLVKGFGFIILANIMHKYCVSCEDVSKIKIYPTCIAIPPDTFSLTLSPRFVHQNPFDVI